MMENLIEGLQRELKRNRILLDAYRAIGAAGGFGVAALTQDIKKAEDAITSGNTIEMMRLYSTLEKNK